MDKTLSMRTLIIVYRQELPDEEKPKTIRRSIKNIRDDVTPDELHQFAEKLASLSTLYLQEVLVDEDYSILASDN